MRHRPSRLVVLVSLQLVLLWHRLAQGGIPERRSDGVGAPPGHTRYGRALPALDGDGGGTDGGLAGEDTVSHQKSNASPKGRSEAWRDLPGAVSQPSSLPPQIQRDSEPLVSNLSSTPTSIPSSPSSGAPLNASLTPSQPTMSAAERLARLAMLKRTMLEQLGLDRPPNVTRAKPNVPSGVLSRLQLNRPQSDQHRRTNQPSQVLVFAEEEEADCGHDVARESCFAFEISEQVRQSQVNSSHLWVYVTQAPEGASVYASRPKHHYGSKRHILAAKKLYSREGWVELDIPAGMLKWNRPQHFLEIGTKGGGNLTGARDARRRPMLLLSLPAGHQGKGRARRSVGMCGSDQETCCMKSFEADFVEIGWDSWIITPLTFYSNYCSGTCGMESRHFLEDYTEMVALHMSNNAAEPDMKLCCVSDDVDDLQIMYIDNAGIIHNSFITLVVRNCGCL